MSDDDDAVDAVGSDPSADDDADSNRDKDVPDAGVIFEPFPLGSDDLSDDASNADGAAGLGNRSNWSCFFNADVQLIRRELGP